MLRSQLSGLSTDAQTILNDNIKISDNFLQLDVYYEKLNIEIMKEIAAYQVSSHTDWTISCMLSRYHWLP